MSTHLKLRLVDRNGKKYPPHFWQSGASIRSAFGQAFRACSFHLIIEVKR